MYQIARTSLGVVRREGNDVAAISASSALMTTTERRPADRRPLHDDETRSLEVLDKALGATMVDMISSALWTRLRR